MKLNLFQNCKSTQSTITSLEDLYQDIKSERYKDKISTLRSLPTEERQAHYKRTQLLGFTYSGEFDGPRLTENVTNYTQIIGLDYDKIEDPYSLRDLANSMPTTMMSFISPRGNGLKVFVSVNSGIEHHKTAWLQVDEFYAKAIGQSSDTSVKDVTRLCFISSDPEAYLNLNAETFKFKLGVFKKEPSVTQVPDFFNKALDDFRPGNRHNTIVSTCGTAMNRGVSKEQLINFFSDYTSSSYTPEELESTVEDCYNRYEYNSPSNITLPNSPSGEGKYDWFSSHDGNKIVYAKLKRDLGSRIVAVPEIERVFGKDDSGRPVFGKDAFNCSYADFFFMLHDNGAKLSDSNFNKLMNSDDIEKLNPLSLFLSELKSSPWDKTKRVDQMIDAMNLAGDMEYNRRMLWKFFCNTYAFAMRGIDEEMPKRVYSRVVLILYTKERNTGKSSFLRQLGMQSVLEEITGISDLDIYYETKENEGKDSYDLMNALDSRFMVNFDDIQNMIIHSGGWLRSLISSETFGHRRKYDRLSKGLIRRAGFVGSTNHKELINDNDENRFLILTLNGRMNYDLLNEIDMMQFWGEIRQEVMAKGSECLYNEDDLDEIGFRGSDYMYVSRNDQVVSDMLVYSREPKLRMNYTQIEEIFRKNGIYFKGNELTYALRKLAPPGEDIYSKSNTKYLLVDIRVDKIGNGLSVPNSVHDLYLGGQGF